jgi:hypothetical protein
LLSTKEKRFVTSPNSFTPDYKQVIKYRLRKKITRMASDIDLLVKNNVDVSPIIDVLSKIQTQVETTQKSAPEPNEDWDV